MKYFNCTNLFLNILISKNFNYYFTSFKFKYSYYTFYYITLLFSFFRLVKLKVYGCWIRRNQYKLNRL